MKNINILSRLITLVISLLLTSCAATTITGSWKEVSYNKPIKNILVIGLSNNKTNRRIFEEILSQDIIETGKNASVSTKYFSDIKNISKKTLAPIVKKAHFDTVIIARVVSINKEQRHVPSSYPTNYGSMYGYYGRVSPYYSDNTNYMATNTIVSLEVNMYETSNAKLVWAITTETFEPGNVNKEVQKISEIIIKKLKEQKLL